MEQKAVCLETGAWRAMIAPELGGNVIALTYRGRDVTVPLSGTCTDPFLAGAPLLLPANRTAGGCFQFEGEEYRLEVNEPASGAHLHGSLHSQRFRVEAQSRARTILSFENREEIYPFPFRIRVTYRLFAQGLLSRYTIENRARTPMPFTFGLHTTFVEPEFFQVALGDRQERDSRHIPTGRYLPLNETERNYLTGSPSKGLNISGCYRAAGEVAYIGREYSYQVCGFDHWVLYNRQGSSGLLCIEPQLGGVNALNDSSRCPCIPPRGFVRLQTVLKLR